MKHTIISPSGITEVEYTDAEVTLHNEVKAAADAKAAAGGGALAGAGAGAGAAGAGAGAVAAGGAVGGTTTGSEAAATPLSGIQNTVDPNAVTAKDKLPLTAVANYSTGSDIPIGLKGSEQALKGTTAGSIDVLDAVNRAGRQDINPYAIAGQDALRTQRALAGLDGQAAFDAAYQESLANIQNMFDFLLGRRMVNPKTNEADRGDINDGGYEKTLDEVLGEL